MNTRIRIFVLAVALLLLGVPGCGRGNAGQVGPPQPVAVFLNQTAVTIAELNQFTFTAVVTGTSISAVSWTLQEGTSGGTITAEGVYTAPGTRGTFHVIATSQADSRRQARATVTVLELQLSISPATDVLGPLGVRGFSPITNFDTTINWSVLEGPAGGSITTTGRYTAPKNTGSFHVVATDARNPAKNAGASLNIVPSGFRPTGSMVFYRSAHTATLLQSGKVLIVGGDPCMFDFYYEDCPVPSAEVYDAGPGTFTATGNMSVPRVFHTATLLSNGKVLVAGGHDSSADLYDPASGKFSATGSMSVGRDSHTATLLPNGKVLIAGGQNVSGTLTTAELYNPASGTFAPTGSMTEPRIAHTATLLANGKVLLTGGSNFTGELATAELYDPAAGTFSAVNSMTGKRAFHTATLLSSGDVLVTGGLASKVSLASAEVYDVNAGIFTAAGAMMTARDSHVAALLPNGNVLVAGGSDFTAELYNAASGKFTQSGSAEVSRQLSAAVLLQDGRVLVSGGSETSSAELYK